MKTAFRLPLGRDIQATLEFSRFGEGITFAVAYRGVVGSIDHAHTLTSTRGYHQSTVPSLDRRLSPVSPDRVTSSHLMKFADAVVVADSLPELSPLAAVHAKKLASLASLPECTFFRDRYKRGEGGESALVVLSDATIRRWRGAKWRIADSRRTRAGAILAEFEAEYAGPLARDTVKSGQSPDRWK